MDLNVIGTGLVLEFVDVARAAQPRLHRQLVRLCRFVSRAWTAIHDYFPVLLPANPVLEAHRIGARRCTSSHHFASRESSKCAQTTARRRGDERAASRNGACNATSPVSSYAVRNPLAARIALVAALDIACLFAAAFAARQWAPPPVSLAAFAAATGVVAIGVFLVLQLTGAYDLDSIRSSPQTCASLLSSMGIVYVATLAVSTSAPYLLPGSKDALLCAAALFLPLLLLERKVFRSLSKRVRKRIVLVGASDLALALARCIERRCDLGLEIVGCSVPTPRMGHVRQWTASRSSVRSTTSRR